MAGFLGFFSVCNQALVIWTVHICTRSNNGNLKRHPTKSEHDTIADLFTAISVHVMSLSLALQPVLQDLQIQNGNALANTAQERRNLCPLRKLMYSLFHRAQREVFFIRPHLWTLQIWTWLCVLAWIPSIIQKPQCNNKQHTRGLADPSSSNRLLCGPETTIYQQANVSGSSGLRPTVRISWARPSRLRH